MCVLREASIFAQRTLLARLAWMYGRSTRSGLSSLSGRHFTDLSFSSYCIQCIVMESVLQLYMLFRANNIVCVYHIMWVCWYGFAVETVHFPERLT